MAEINILFPESGRTMVMPDPEAVVTGRPFLFVIKNENPRIKAVRIEFGKDEFEQEARFFPDPTKGRQLAQEKEFPKSKELERELKIAEEKGEKRQPSEPYREEVAMWAEAPARSGRAKYTVYAMDGSGAKIPEATLDPQILPTDPR
jgi:hypothetical protein